ncbi:ADP-ribosylglycohydrolase [Micromonospora rhizosphaerae]|uniref:ADP-ribosylglycohydrolase n=1 Tax=Micromonospora rhizosphaerae TaxID=568872 RepID=A0A1C6SMV7_9ACTN|nr:ADP-ribosylglycohydrolase family protein [Micromonospora rhizosphaerae]SCL30844.1 ADP-ribosylglycohydrolase [Micromonospora rhizosphaerae]
MRVTWVQPEDVLPHELRQATAEGRDVTDIAARWQAAGGPLQPPHGGASQPPATPVLRALARELLEELSGHAGIGSADEPNDFDAIRATWGTGPVLPKPTDRDALLERLHGGWLGRASGCLLGKPVEKIPREGIRAILEDTGRYPLDYYFTAVGLSDEVNAAWPWNRASRPTSLVENIDGMPEDDDLNYTLLALHILETYGRDFTTDDVAQTWLLELPGGRVFTAERAAYRNLLDGYDPPETATRGNPFREWIGAQIRTDLYGWANPGDVATAAEMAWRDARVSHTRNGLYGAMYVAAMAAAACVTDDVEQVIDAGLSVVPPRSRLAAAVTAARELAHSGLDLEAGLDRLHAAHEGQHWVHVINNAALVTYALAHGRGDFVTSICAAVVGGWDTDSDGATVGAITGALCGADRLPEQWISPLKNRLASSIASFDGIGFDELARRTGALVDGL